MAASQQLCTFVLDGLAFGVDVMQVQEVVHHRETTRVPLAPPVVRGLINLRGQIVAALDLRRRLELAEQPEGRLPTHVVLRTEEGAVSLLVDEVGDVIEVTAASFERPPETVRGAARDLICGVHKLEDRLLLVLDAAQVVQGQGRNAP